LVNVAIVIAPLEVRRLANDGENQAKMQATVASTNDGSLADFVSLPHRLF
jgi:hypothetical protein